MRTIWQSLAWKEWHENKWTLVSILAIFGGVTFLAAFNVEDRGVLPVTLALMCFCVVPLSIFVGLGVATGERSRGTLPFLRALPVPLWRVALHKFVAGLITIALPAAVVTLSTYLVCKALVNDAGHSPALLSSASSRSWSGSWLVDAALGLGYLCISFYLWTIGTGVNRKDEVSAAAATLVTMAGWALALWFVWISLTSMADAPTMAGSPFSWLLLIGRGTLPGGLITIVGEPLATRPYIPLAITAAAIVNVALAARYFVHFGRAADLEIQSPRTADIRPGRNNWLGPPRSSAFAAIAWKQFRESGPVVLTGVAGIVGLFAAILVVNWRSFRQYPSEAINLMSVVSGTIGVCIAMVLGIGVFRNEVSPGLNTFWRSRPISPDMWFWTKFLCGLVITLVSIYTPSLILAGWAGWRGFHSDFAVIPIMLVAIFAAAVAMICLVRHTVYAAVLSIAVTYLGVVGAALAVAIGRVIQGQGWPDSFREFFRLTIFQVAAGLMASFVLSTLVAWLAVRNDWGQKSVR